MRSGFSLVELSIVLVILGLLTGGILAGQSLIRAAELRAVTTEYSRYGAAVQSFRDKYFALPGDMANATKFWGVGTLCSGAAANGTCDGNGNGQLMFGFGAPGVSGEIFQFWRQLALAGLIEGTYSGASGSGSNIHMVSGTNVPPSRLGGGMWGIREFFGQAVNISGTFDGTYTSMATMGAASAGTENTGVILKPEEMWNLDTKMDDGKPALGRIVARFVYVPSNPCTNATVSSASNADYSLQNSSVACVFASRDLFN